jgi:glutamate/tyrosine decarboxylase-like PLP-dependent enzyme
MPPIKCTWLYPKPWPSIGRDNLHYVPCDDSYRMVPSLLERAIRQDEAQGREPIAVVASAGTVNT